MVRVSTEGCKGCAVPVGHGAQRESLHSAPLHQRDGRVYLGNGTVFLSEGSRDRSTFSVRLKVLVVKWGVSSWYGYVRRGVKYVQLAFRISRSMNCCRVIVIRTHRNGSSTILTSSTFRSENTFRQVSDKRSDYGQYRFDEIRYNGETLYRHYNVSPRSGTVRGKRVLGAKKVWTWSWGFREAARVSRANFRYSALSRSGQFGSAVCARLLVTRECCVIEVVPVPPAHFRPVLQACDYTLYYRKTFVPARTFHMATRTYAIRGAKCVGGTARQVSLGYRLPASFLPFRHV